jgi:hypothetical protein
MDYELEESGAQSIEALPTSIVDYYMHCMPTSIPTWGTCDRTTFQHIIVHIYNEHLAGQGVALSVGSPPGTILLYNKCDESISGHISTSALVVCLLCKRRALLNAL